MAIHQSIRELIGNTPLVQLNRYASKRGLGANILAKIEYFNPAGIRERPRRLCHVGCRRKSRQTQQRNCHH